MHISRCSFGYRRRDLVLEDLTLELPSGCVVLLGPNGAGKSTLLALLASALSPHAGNVTLGDLDTRRRGDLKHYRRQVGWLPQQVSPVPGLRVREQAAYAGWLKGMSRRDAWDSSLEAIKQVGLGDLAERSAARLSGGQLRRLGIAQTLVHSARVVLMDEPTAGLDPTQRRVFRALLEGLKSRASFVVSTHQTEDLADSYDSVVLLDQGRVLFQGSTDSFLDLAPRQVAQGRRAEAAYAGLVREEV
ncbi:ATP-binding cassette domain-containing protein [Streptomyces somaliensis DSM 40738]|uniref:ATP-binding cassette domain-containing protein n=1 Tax=Streptomyces somaliensis (strain ATCC 33201 / DSM 40738 / JCM 12659 / KCTC 9044 / NCTC 11332 / NRRL B-12077 / IP 733) TaxID=1134445 RepID=A0AA44DE38_STRE0|nr:ATP-binding cassette domain-containing protein [Streptomyces somaliensis]MCQ0024375.1 ATP-binding cassette domain-containing protein [Streptomyces somaliensis DSM 40738]NKY14763.1 ATP-binding cassette domain-containing protein [Streptomyces somaliensis DSM 40738]